MLRRSLLDNHRCGNVGCAGMSPYLHQLTLRLAAGVLQLPEALRQVHAGYVKSLQQSDGGFPGREGGSDLYYTGFALRSLFLLGELSGPTADHAADFLRSRFQLSQNVLDLLSLIYGATLLEFSAGIDVLEAQSPSWRDAVAATLERLRRDDGGYAKTSEGGASSTYHSFLAALCLQLIGRPLPEPRAAGRIPLVPALRRRRVSRHPRRQAGRHEPDGRRHRRPEAARRAGQRCGGRYD